VEREKDNAKSNQQKTAETVRRQLNPLWQFNIYRKAFPQVTYSWTICFIKLQLDIILYYVIILKAFFKHPCVMENLTEHSKRLFPHICRGCHYGNCRVVLFLNQLAV
jgi:hypothetical protein